MSHHPHDPASCRELVAKLSEYLDEELPPELCSVIEAHFEDCPPCREFLESLRRTILWVETLERPRLPDDLREKLAARMRNLPHGN